MVENVEGFWWYDEDFWLKKFDRIIVEKDIVFTKERY